ncbi:membrane-bound lytic murein transglycosylase MltF [Rheinheimera sp.]|uniref:membrane-bound lytic murein transglycosylase MltF n=1 Tax=Rheinheimera sp. TaxID=1869214 RepID=UPI00307F5B26
MALKLNKNRICMRRLGVPFLLAFLLCGCAPEPQPLQLHQIYQRDTLRVGILNSPTSYYIAADGPAGYDYELVQSLADKLGVELELFPSYQREDLLQKLDSGQVDLIAGGLAVTESRKQKYRIAPAYLYRSEVVVYRKGGTQPKNFADLTEPLLVPKDSSLAETLQEATQQHPNLNWQESELLDTEELLQQVEDGKIPYTLVDSNLLAVNQRFYPNLTVAFQVKRQQPVAWLLNKQADDSFWAVLIEFFGQNYQSGDLLSLEDKYFGHIRRFDYIATVDYIKAIEKDLPRYQPLFEKYAGSFDWRLLAAIGYQESNWRPSARSSTGVVGLMMLTVSTAQAMGVSSRLDPAQSIKGGARYLERMLERIPERIPMPDRLWFAIAAYNIGWGHVESARVLTERDGGNPDQWHEVKQRLPWLQQKRYYQNTKLGYARGAQAVYYVENVRRFYDTLLWVDEKKKTEQRLDQQKQMLNQQFGDMPPTDPKTEGNSKGKTGSK